MSVLSSARFATSVADADPLHTPALKLLPEIAFAGRSNAGKSSTLNTLVGRRQLAYASKTPGRTQMLNFFELAERSAHGEAVPVAYLVDLPGYGFARVDAATRAKWDQLVGGYLRDRRMLVGVVLVMDARHLLKPADAELIGWLGARERPQRLRLHLLLNKADQLTATGRRQAMALAEARAHDLPMPTSVQLFSALKREGVEELRDTVLQMLGR
jgi:GTP-binding protein